MYRFFSIFFVSLLCSISALAQSSLSGKVCDDDSNPLVGATVQILSTKLGAVTDSDGWFQLKTVPKGNISVKASSLGYAPQTQNITIGDSKVTLNFSLEIDAVRHKEILVREDSPIQKMRKAPESIVVIDAEEIRGRATAIEAILTKATGIKIRKTGGLGSASRINIHGLEGKGITILIDGNPLNSPEGNFTIDEIPIDLIERIEVYKGVVPARFGGDGTGGVVNIIFREFEYDYLDVSYQRGSYNTNRATWTFKKVFPELGMEVSTGGFFNKADNDYTFESPYQDGVMITRDHDEFLSYAYGAGLVFNKLWFEEIELGVDVYRNRKEIQGIRTNIQFAESRASAVIPNLNLEKEDFFLENLDFENTLQVVIMGYNFIDTSHVHYNLDGSINTDDTYQGEIGSYANDSDDKQLEIRNKLNLLYTLSDVHSLNLNHNFRRANYEPEDELASEYAGYNISGYPSNYTSNIIGLTHQMRLLDERFISMTGVSLFQMSTTITSNDYIDDNNLREPSISENDFAKMGYSEALRYRPLHWLNLKASYQHAMRLPYSNELFGDGVYILASPNLAPEESDNMNLGFFIDTYSFAGLHRVQFEANAFYTDLTNKIQLSSDGVNYAYENLGHVVIKGFDAELKLDISKAFYLHGNFTYQLAKDAKEFRDDGTSNPTYDMKVPNIPWLFGNFGIEYHRENVLGAGTFLKLFLESSYTHEYFYNWEISKRNPRRIPTNFSHDVGIEMAFDNNRYILSFEVQNVTDEDLITDFQLPLMGRAAYFKVRYSFLNAVH
ncbi:TonB-dependent receptor plug [Chloroherpeton thalassium ATCC 35110]|uniref:TonB-dependent receptor plug n=1 Tax=Chloroherpeton thalassium (strain ATCC 35110 / GB-78) TaxID=517418 RepID=B3QXH8_CHLT3|nr:TonB-dependent receptor [Chloroherpeton thalassium]ACF13452.1 TonB-dependent receptor plug [Chloroherpeton thalassium ATCC 35110]